MSEPKPCAICETVGTYYDRDSRVMRNADRTVHSCVASLHEQIMRVTGSLAHMEVVGSQLQQDLATAAADRDRLRAERVSEERAWIATCEQLRSALATARAEVAALQGSLARRATEDAESIAWLTSMEGGTSAKTIWSVMTGYPVERTDVPYDSGDFGRCHRLLQRFPQWRVRMHEVADAHPCWSLLVDDWATLTAMYESEDPTLSHRIRNINDETSARRTRPTSQDTETK